MIENETNQTMYFVFVGADSLRRSMGQEQPTLFFTGSCLSRGRTRASLWPIGRNPPDLSQRRWQSDLCGKVEPWIFSDSGGTISGDVLADACGSIRGRIPFFVWGCGCHAHKGKCAGGAFSVARSYRCDLSVLFHGR